MQNQAPLTAKEITGSELLTIEQMAARLQVKPSWLYFRTMQTGANSIPRLKIGKYLRFEPGKVMQWIETNYGGVNGKS
jgi:predicted DNA-binding transcriptional regulator AlpA